MHRLKPGDRVYGTSDLAGVKAITASRFARPGSRSNVWERDETGGWRGRISSKGDTLDTLLNQYTYLWVLETEGGALTLPEPPDGTVALIGGETGARYTRYLRIASWQDSGGQVFSLGALLDFERELTPEVEPTVAVHLERVRASIHAGAPAEVWASLDAIKAALLQDGAA